MEENRAVSEVVIGLNDLIILDGEETTIWTEFEKGGAFALRANHGPYLGEHLTGHWAVISGHSFPISWEDHAYLLGSKQYFQAGDRVRFKSSSSIIAFGPPNRRGKTATVIRPVSDGTMLKRVDVMFDGETEPLMGIEASFFEEAEY